MSKFDMLEEHRRLSKVLEETNKKNKKKKNVQQQELTKCESGQSSLEYEKTCAKCNVSEDIGKDEFYFEMKSIENIEMFERAMAYLDEYKTDLRKSKKFDFILLAVKLNDITDKKEKYEKELGNIICSLYDPTGSNQYGMRIGDDIYYLSSAIGDIVSKIKECEKSITDLWRIYQEHQAILAYYPTRIKEIKKQIKLWKEK